MIQEAAYWIKKLNLEKHPEGGWFKEVYRSEDTFVESNRLNGFPDTRNFSTSIYYQLVEDDFSAFHRIKSDEIWHYYDGNSAIEIISIEHGKLRKQYCSNHPQENHAFQIIVPKNTWFAAYLSNPKGFALVGCTVSPGFHFNDFELAGNELLEEYPELESQIRSLIRG